MTSKRIDYDRDLISRARQLRLAGILSEVLLWEQLNGRKLGVRFTRQKPLGHFIVDFYCPRLHLAIEIDGSSHHAKIEQDQRRQHELEALGVRVLRFQDHEVRRNLSGVVKAIEEEVRLMRNATR